MIQALQQRVSSILERYFFRPTAAQSLSLFRFLFCISIAWHLAADAPGAMRQYHSVSWNPIPLFQRFGVELMSLGAFKAWCAIVLVALVMTALGIFTRISATVAWIAYFIYVGTHLGFTKAPDTNYVYHSKNIMVFVLMILSVAPGVGRWGLDGWRSRNWRWRISDPQDAYVSAWPTQLIVLAIGIAYFGSGYCKVVTSPLWADGYTLQAYLVMKHLLLDVEPGIWLASHYWLCLALSIFTLALELTFFLTVFHPRLKWIYIPSGLSFHLMVFVTMQIHFTPFYYVYLVFLDWPTLVGIATFPARFWRRALPAMSTATREIAANAAGAIPSLGDTPWARRFVLGMSAMLFLCVVGRIESWPFTDYCVFQNRNRIDKLQVFRMAGITSEGKVEFLSRSDHPISPVSINTRLRTYHLRKNSAGAEKIMAQVARHLEDMQPGRFDSLIIVERTVEGDSLAGRFEYHNHQVAQMALGLSPTAEKIPRTASFNSDVFGTQLK